MVVNALFPQVHRQDAEKRQDGRRVGLIDEFPDVCPRTQHHQR